MQTNYKYLLDHSIRAAQQQRNARILDFGCGGGQLVIAGRTAGLDFYGADVFYAGNRTKAMVEQAGLLGKEIREIKEGRIDFEDSYFDIVTSNQVFEHVEPLDSVLQEIHRVMKKGALLLSLFPTLESIRESHIGIPFAHHFSRDSSARYPFVLAMRSMGFGSFKNEASSCAEWTRKKLEWIDKYTYYRNRSEIIRVFSKYFQTEAYEADHIKFRLQEKNAPAWMHSLLDMPLVPGIGGQVFTRLGGTVIGARKV